ncbi:MAG TPA: type II toxin-antitoxin system PemK/MazF family toxin [Candidatus Eisenbacteria bacterium]
MIRGEVWWANLERPFGSEPGYRRPVVIIQSDKFNQSRIGTVIIAVITSNIELAESPGNIPLKARTADLPRKSVVNVSQLLTVDRRRLTGRLGQLPPERLAAVDAGLRRVLSL